MRISDEQVKKVLSDDRAAYHDALIGPISRPVGREEDKDLIDALTAEVMKMPDREDYVAELQAKIQSGEYNPSGDEIVDAMIRRAIADRIR